MTIVYANRLSDIQLSDNNIILTLVTELGHDLGSGSLPEANSSQPVGEEAVRVVIPLTRMATLMEELTTAVGGLGVKLPVKIPVSGKEYLGKYLDIP